MSKIERIDYFSNCPSCGAPGGGSDVCAFCGTSLVRQKCVMESPMSVEDALLQEDAGIAVVKGKLCEISSFFKVFCPLFGGIFLLIPTALFIAFLAAGLIEAWLIILLGAFWAIGVAAFVPLILAFMRKKKCVNGRIVQGEVRGYEDGVYCINEKPVQVIRVRIDDESGSKIVLLNTGKTHKDYAIGSVVKLRNNGMYFQYEG